MAEVGGHQLRVPRGHPYAPDGFASKQPLRNKPLEILGAVLVRAYPGASILDVGANVGDTAMLLGLAGSDLILVEPDPLYVRLLNLNLDALSGVRRVETVAIASHPLRGDLASGAGTAKIRERDGGAIIATKTLEQVCDPDTKLIKIDTDGWDFDIIRSGLGFLAARRPLIFFELECRSRRDLEDALVLVDELLGAGYEHFCVWDDSGLLILGECDSDHLAQLAESLCHGTRACPQRTTSHGYDVLAVAPEDHRLLQDAVTLYREAQWAV